MPFLLILLISILLMHYKYHSIAKMTKNCITKLLNGLFKIAVQYLSQTQSFVIILYSAFKETNRYIYYAKFCDCDFF